MMQESDPSRCWRASVARLRRVVLGTAAVCMMLGPAEARAQTARSSQVRVTELAPGYFLLAEPTANMVVYANDNGAVVSGIHTPALVTRSRELLRSRRAGPDRHVLVMESDSAPSYGDAEWGRTGARTLVHEMVYVRMRRWARANRTAGTESASRHALPAMSFSHVVQLYLAPEEIHFIRDRAASTDGDVVVHFEEEGIVHLGNLFTSDGYPPIDSVRGGSVDGMITWINFFVSSFVGNPAKIEPIVPGRGPVATMADLRAYRDMLVAVRDRVKAHREAGKSLEEVVAARPSAEFDARWGRGPVRPDQFVASVYRTVRITRPQASPTTTPAPTAAPEAYGHSHGQPATPPARPEERPTRPPA